MCKYISSMIIQIFNDLFADSVSLGSFHFKIENDCGNNDSFSLSLNDDDSDS